MSLTIKHPDKAFTGEHSGLSFTDGVAEHPALEDAARGPLLENGFTIEGEDDESPEDIAAREAAEAAEKQRLADEEAAAEAKRAADEATKAQKAPAKK